MGFFKSLIGKRTVRHLDDPDFGRISEHEAGCWTGEELHLWGYSQIQIMLDGDSEGPTTKQRSLLKTLREDPEGIRERIELAVAQLVSETTDRQGTLKPTSIFLPEAPPDQMWRVWYDVVGEDSYSFGAEIEGWQNIVAFAED